MIRVANQSANLEDFALLLLELDSIPHLASPTQFPLFSLEKRKADLRKVFDNGYIFYAERDSQIMGFASVIKKEKVLVTCVLNLFI